MKDFKFILLVADLSYTRNIAEHYVNFDHSENVTCAVVTKWGKPTKISHTFGRGSGKACARFEEIVSWGYW